MKKGLLKTFTVVLTLVLMCFAVVTASAEQEYDYTITADTSIDVEIFSGSLTYIKFVPTVSGVYTFESESDEDTYGYLYDADLKELTHDDDGTGNRNFKITYTLRKGVTYYFGVRYYNEGNSGNFTVILTFDEVLCDHESTKTVAGKAATCYIDGYTDGVQCNNCNRFVSDHTVIRASHTDEDEDGYCELCEKTMPINEGTCGGNVLYWDEDYEENHYDGAAKYYKYADGTLEVFGEGEIESEAFGYSSSIYNVIIYEGITKINSYAFYDCDYIKSVTILNSNCAIYDSSSTIDSDATIYGHEGSSAQNYANKYGRDFVVYCSHESTTNIAEKAASCYIFGNTEGVKCNDCEHILSGYEVIVPSHTDKNETDKCDVCKKVMPIESGSCGGFVVENEYDDDCWDDDCYEDDNNYDGSARYYRYADGTLEIFGKGKIESYAFYNEDDIINVVIMEGITEIGDWAFCACENLETVTIPDSVTSIGNRVFREYEDEYDDLLNVMICCNKNSYALSYAEEYGLMYLLLDGTDEENTISDKIGKYNWSINKKTGVMTLTGSGAMVDFTTVDAPWYEYYKYVKELVLPEGLTTIGESAFFNFYNLTSVEIPETVTAINRCAFQYCGFTSVEIPDSVTEIGEMAFYDCSNLKTVTIGENVKTIGEEAFEYCESLESITIPDSVTTMGRNVFESCDNLTDVIIGDGLKYIPYWAFAYCDKLKNVTIGENVERINDWAFDGCSSLESITIPYNMKEINSQAFDCVNLKEVIVFSTDCEFSTDCGINYNHTIYGFVGSTAEAFADDIGAEFIDVETIHTHDYKAETIKGYCSYKKCYCGKIDSLLCVDADYNAICDNCKKSTNGIEIDETLTFNFNDYEYFYIPFTAAKSGEYTISFDKEMHSVRFYNEDKSDYQTCDEYIEDNKFMFELDEGQKGYWYFYKYFDDTVNVSLTFRESHTHKYTSKITKKATCTTNGKTVYTCSCGSSYTETIWSYGHSFGSWYISQYGSCTETAVLSKDCDNCDYTENMRFPASGEHTEEEIIVKATDTDDGKVITMCSVCGKKIRQRSVAKIASVKLSSSKVVYNGKTRTPSVTVKDSNGDLLVKDIDYTVSYASGRKSPGVYKITVKFKGDYSGTEKLTFTIVPEKVETISYKAASTTSIKLSWSEVEGATDYRVYIYSASKDKYVSVAFVTGATSYTVTGRSAGTTYKFKVRAYTELSDGSFVYSDLSSEILASTKPAAPKITKITSTTKGKAVVEWSNVSGETGYQLYYSTSKDGTYKKVKSYGADVLKGSKSSITSGKTIYFKVRAYKKVNGETIYGDWSAVKSVKIK